MEKIVKPALLLLPNLIGDHKYHQSFLPSSVDKAVETIDGLIAESETEGRRFLDRFTTKKPSREIPIALLNEHTKENDFDFLLEPIKNGERWGLISDAGLPCVCDPGSKLVKRAKQIGIIVQAFVGPSSIMLALMLSGFNGQKFTFHGYLDPTPENRKKQIINLEKNAKNDESTQIFIETPYRNKYVLEALINTLQDNTWICIAYDLTMATQSVLSYPISVWKKMPLPNLEKKPCVFLISKE